MTPKVQDMVTLLRLLVRGSMDIMDITMAIMGMVRVLLGLPLAQVMHHLLAVIPAKHTDCVTVDFDLYCIES